MIIAFLYAVIIGILYFFSSRYELKNKSNEVKVVSAAAGISITYVLLEFFPVFIENSLTFGKFMYLTVLLGFIAHHIIEKEIYIHNSKNNLRRLLNLEENVFSFTYHIFLGLILSNLTSESLLKSFLFVIPILTFTLVNSLPHKKIDSIQKSISLSFSTLIGVMLNTLIGFSNLVITSLHGITVGILLYNIIRHHIPFGRKGKVSYFTVAFIIYGFIITYGWIST